MNIALIGEYSGVHTSLKAGLEVLGHHVDLYSDGDNFKKIPGSRELYPDFSGRMAQIKHALFDLPSALDVIANEYDAIQLINPNAISSYGGLHHYYGHLLSRLKKSKALKSLAVAGCETNIQRGLSTMQRSHALGA